jgi:hypothetical protein
MVSCFYSSNMECISSLTFLNYCFYVNILTRKFKKGLTGIEQKVLRNFDPYDAAEEAWPGFNLKALLLFSIYFAGEFSIIVLFYRMFRNFLGKINKEM